MDIHNKIFAQGLMVDCPMGKPLENCPLLDLRKLPLKTRMQLVDEMSEEKLEETISYHKQCLAKREY